MRRTMINADIGRHRSPKRTEAGNAPELLFMPSDGLMAGQWHLANTGQTGGTAGIDANVTAVWDEYSGEGVSIGVYDDAIDYGHHDLNDNYDASLHLVFGGTTYSAMPYTATESHGTAVAGLIAAENDGDGSVGVAWGSSITGVPILRSSGAPDLLAALGEMDRFDIVNHSWGYTTPFQVNFLSADPFWSGFESRIVEAASGRGGLGTIIVKSAGNNRASGHETNYDNFTNHRQVIAVGAVDHKGMVSYYSTPGASLLLAAPSSSLTVGLTTTDLSGAAGADPGDYRTNFGGTSAAAPIVTGVVALMLEANPDLGWRDVQEILAYSARRVGSTGGALAGYEEYVWSFNGADNWNGGGLHFSNDYGFGLVDALAAVRLAESWILAGTSANEAQVSASGTVNAVIPDNGSVTRTFTLQAGVTIDHVELVVDIAHANRGDLRIMLTSPDGTTSILLDRPLNGSDTGDNLVFRLGSNAFWGEQSGGTWTVTILDMRTGNVGTVNSLVLRAYGDTATADDLYVFTNEYASVGADPARTTLADGDGGVDTLNAAAVTAASTLDLRSGSASTIAGRTLTIAAGTVIEIAYGGDGSDVVIGNAAANRLHGNRGDDLLDGGAGNDVLDGGAGSDTARFAGERARYTINSENGGYRITDSLAGGDGSDWLVNMEKAQFSDGLYTVDGSLIGGPPPPPPPPPPSGDIVGTSGDDELEGGSGADRIFGNGGNDRLRGRSGADRLDGGAGIDVADFALSAAGVTVSLATNDNRNGDAEGDLLYSVENVIGSGFADTLVGDGSANTLTGGAGNDILDGGAGADTLLGGAGDDSFYVDTSGDVLVENAGEGRDGVFASVAWTLAANFEDLTLIGQSNVNGTGNDLANVLTGNGAANILDGGAGDDIAAGGAGNDTLHGRAGNDRLDGGDGADVLVGGAGRDDLIGGAGKDRFDFDSVGDTAAAAGDRILDFVRGSDVIDLSTIDARLGTKKNDVFQFIGEGSFTGAAGQLRYERFDLAGTADDYTLIQGDINGDRIADFAILLMGPTTMMQSGDFIL